MDETTMLTGSARSGDSFVCSIFLLTALLHFFFELCDGFCFLRWRPSDSCATIEKYGDNNRKQHCCRRRETPRCNKKTVCSKESCGNKEHFPEERRLPSIIACRQTFFKLVGKADHGTAHQECNG